MALVDIIDVVSVQGFLIHASVVVDAVDLRVDVDLQPLLYSDN